jgi:hypothetical protein
MKLSNKLLSAIAITVLFLTFSTPTTVAYRPVITPEAKQITSTDIYLSKLTVKFSHKQANVLNMAFDIAKQDGHVHPQILQGIVLQESGAGSNPAYKVVNSGREAYFGLAQIKVAAAKDVLKKYPNLRKEFEFQTSTDEEIMAKLIENDRFNLTIASKYLLVLKTYGYKTVRQLALAYNQGPTGAKKANPNTHHYPLGVERNIKTVFMKV